MNTYRMNAVGAGVLYIIGTVAGIFSLIYGGSVLDMPDYLAQVSADPNQVVIGSLFILTMGLALAMVPVVLFPVLKKFNEVLAVGYVIFRGALETCGYFILAIGWISITLISQAYVTADTSYFQSLGDLVLKTHDQIGNIMTIVFILGALMFYSALYQSKLVPRWLSSWGLLTAIPYLAAGVLGMFALVNQMSSTYMFMVIPLALQEMVLAIWLIVKGFNPSAFVSETT